MIHKRITKEDRASGLSISSFFCSLIQIYFLYLGIDEDIKQRRLLICKNCSLFVVLVLFHKGLFY